MAMTMVKKQKNEFWRKLRHKSGCCCFGWAVYAPWACYMNLRTLYVIKPAKCPLIYTHARVRTKHTHRTAVHHTGIQGTSIVHSAVSYEANAHQGKNEVVAVTPATYY